jgi:hypothetical protein
MRRLSLPSVNSGVDEAISILFPSAFKFHGGSLHGGNLLRFFQTILILNIVILKDYLWGNIRH